MNGKWTFMSASFKLQNNIIGLLQKHKINFEQDQAEYLCANNSVY